eukprot:COSAG01_NODE_2579_length_7430_cov_18.300505_8_plen_57_part_01
MTGATMEYMSRKKDQNGISHPRMTLIGILKFDGGTSSKDHPGAHSTRNKPQTKLGS